MANLKKSSFQKRDAVKRNLIEGTSPSLHNSQLLISSGIPSFDSLIGGGIPVGSIQLINEDEYATYAKLMVKYFMAEGIVSRHGLFIASEDINLEEMVQELPSPVESDVKEADESETLDKKMTIAWRYENLKSSSFEKHKHFGHYFDLSKTMNPDLIKNSDITLFPGKKVKSDKSFEESIYFALLKSIQKKLEEGLYFANQTNAERKILRIVLFHMNSPLWHCDINSNSEIYLLKFLFSLRALIRNAYATCCFTLPYSMNKKYFLNKCIHFVDSAVQLQSFAGTKCENVAPFKDYHGFFIIQKLAAINTLLSYNSKVTNLAFKLRRKKLVIEAFYLPPELEDSTEREQDETFSMSCSSSRIRFGVSRFDCTELMTVSFNALLRTLRVVNTVLATRISKTISLKTIEEDEPRWFFVIRDEGRTATDVQSETYWEFLQKRRDEHRRELKTSIKIDQANLLIIQYNV